MRAADRLEAKDGIARLKKMADWLEQEYPAAANSLRETVTPRCSGRTCTNTGFRIGSVSDPVNDAEIVPQFVYKRLADLLADFCLARTDGFDVLLVKHDVGWTCR